MGKGENRPQAESKVIFLEYVDRTVGFTDSANTFVLKPISASEAFRKYNWLAGSPVLNKSGNLRGMVINAPMRTVYTISGKAAERLAVLAALVEIGKEMARIQSIWGSDADWTKKTEHITMLGSFAILRSVTSIVPTVIELGALSVAGYGELYSALTGSSSGSVLARKVTEFAAEIRTTHSRQWDGENWYNFINTTVR